LVYLFRQLGCADAVSLGPWLSSDTLWPVNVFTDIFTDHYSLSGWVFSIAPCWFPDIFATGLFWLLTRNVILATLFAGFIQIGLIVGALHLCRKAVGIRGFALQDTFLLGTGVMVTLYVARHPGSLYPGVYPYPGFYQFFLPQTHVGSLVLVLYALGLALLLVARKRESGSVPRSILVGYGILCLLGGLSNLLFLVHMLAPFTASLCFAVFFGMLTVRDVYTPVVVGWPSAAIGVILNRVLFNAADVGTQAGISISRVATCLDTFVRGAAAKILAGDPLHLAAIAWLVLCGGYVLYTRALALQSRERLKLPQIMACLFLLSCLLASVCSGASIILGGSNGLAVFKDYLWSMHYMHPAFLLPIFGLPLLLSWGISQAYSERVCQRLAMLLALLAVAAPAYKIATGAPPSKQIYAYRPSLVQFMDELAKGEHLEYGYAGYWQARLITLLSKQGLRAFAVDGSLNPLLWVSNRQWYNTTIEDRGKRPRIDFVVLDDPKWKISKDAAVRVLGEPTREARFEGTRVLIYSSAK
jgi:hypothetical protein